MTVKVASPPLGPGDQHPGSQAHWVSRDPGHAGISADFVLQSPGVAWRRDGNVYFDAQRAEQCFWHQLL